MNKEQIRETIFNVLHEIAPEGDVQTIDPDRSFHDQLEVDSIDFLRLMMALEQTLGIEIFDFDYPKLSTLRGCEDYLAAKLAA
ncbi:MAG: acyl carrier protein [Gammaproteobacteria bacterium]|nr:acyl carrier protein [Gammaproteobacteria bacterium]MCP5424208.1 acyl carrier protein [Gammaproteobacteria bacterium]MCP5458915.1 acyl carrier protein [Gammaproteobacteria bacterium]